MDVSLWKKSGLTVDALSMYAIYPNLSYYICDKRKSCILAMDISPANFDQNAHVVDSTEKQPRNQNLNKILCLEIKQ